MGTQNLLKGITGVIVAMAAEVVRTTGGGQSRGLSSTMAADLTAEPVDTFDLTISGAYPGLIPNWISDNPVYGCTCISNKYWAYRLNLYFQHTT